MSWSLLSTLMQPLARRQLIEQRPRLLQVRRIKALSEPAVDLGEHLAGFCTLALALPQPAQTHRSTQLPGFRLLAAGNVEGLTKAGFRLRVLLRRARQQELGLESIQFCCVVALLNGVYDRQRLSQDAQP